jgi:hypothetical protein
VSVCLRSYRSRSNLLVRLLAEQIVDVGRHAAANTHTHPKRTAHAEPTAADENRVAERAGTNRQRRQRMRSPARAAPLPHSLLVCPPLRVSAFLSIHRYSPRLSGVCASAAGVGSQSPLCRCRAAHRTVVCAPVSLFVGLTLYRILWIGVWLLLLLRPTVLALPCPATEISQAKPRLSKGTPPQNKTQARNMRIGPILTRIAVRNMFPFVSGVLRETPAALPPSAQQAKGRRGERGKGGEGGCVG